MTPVLVHVEINKISRVSPYCNTSPVFVPHPLLTMNTCMHQDTSICGPMVEPTEAPTTTK